MNNLILIGNGFDLAHGLKTSYNHFIEWLVNEHCKNRKFASEFFDIPDDVKNYKNLCDLVRDKPNELIYYKDRASRLSVSNFFTSNLMSSLVQDLSLNNWCDIEAKYFELLNAEHNPKYLNDDFEILKKYLKIYLKKQENKTKEGKSKSKPIERYKELFSTLDSPHTLILNFNYTHTIENLYRTEKTESKIIHMHGELDSSDNPMVFGYAADHDETRKLSDKKNNEYLRNIKKHLYKRANNESQLLKYMRNTKEIDVSILGHSCGLSDKLILNQILNNENVRSIRYFYYKEYEYYFDAIVNIDRIMKNDNEFRERIINFQDSFRMPQHDDYKNDLKEFVDYIQNISIDQETRYNYKHNIDSADFFAR